MEEVKGTSGCVNCYRYVQMMGRKYCIGKVGVDRGIKEIVGWKDGPCENFMEYPWLRSKKSKE